MNRTKILASALLLLVLPFAAPTFASDRDHGDRGRGHERGHEYGRDRHGQYDYDRHYYRPHESYRHDYRGHDNRASVTLPFPPLPPFPVIIVKPHH